MAAIQCESSSLNGMTDEEIVKSLRDGAFSNVSTLPGLGAYRRALRILSTSASPLAHAFIKEYTNETWDVQKALSAFRMGDLIQNVETGETQRWERQGVVNGSLILNAVPYKLDQLRLLDHEAMECRGRGPPSFMSPENGKNRGGYAEATPREGDVVVHKESGAVSIVPSRSIRPLVLLPLRFKTPEGRPRRREQRPTLDVFCRDDSRLSAVLPPRVHRLGQPW